MQAPTNIPSTINSWQTNHWCFYIEVFSSPYCNSAVQNANKCLDTHFWDPFTSSADCLILRFQFSCAFGWLRHCYVISQNFIFIHLYIILQTYIQLLNCILILLIVWLLCATTLLIYCTTNPLRTVWLKFDASKCHNVQFQLSDMIFGNCTALNIR